MIDGWRNILGPRPTFPRDVLVQIPGLNRDGERNGKYDTRMQNIQHYYRFVEDNAPRRDMWAGWSPANMYDAKQMEWVYGDIDSHDLQTSLEEARAYEERCMEVFGVQPVAIFSCGKGFHLHFTHDPIPYRSRAYADAVVHHMDGVDLDIAPLKHRRAKPRIPYTMNLKATGREMQAMYVVPVDLSWDLGEIMARAKACDAMAFKVPHSASAGKMLAEKAERIEERLVKARGKPRDTEKESQIVKAALTFCKQNGPFMVDRHGRADGRKRMIYSLLVPALMHHHCGDENMVLAEAEEFVVDCGGRWTNYHSYVLQCISNCVMDDGQVRLPMGLKRFFVENNGLSWSR